MGLPTYVSVGTVPVLAAFYRENRTSIRVLFVPTSILSGNLGTVNVGIGIPPDSVQGNPTAGEPLLPGGELKISEDFPGDPAVPRESIWLIADRAAQVCIVEEDAYSPDDPERSVPVFVTGQGAAPGARAPPRSVPVPSPFQAIGIQVGTPGTIPSPTGLGAAVVAGPAGGPAPGPSPTPTGTPTPAASTIRGGTPLGYLA